ncbi:MAG: choice-of-anchor B family protein [Candidatus Eisenbacteria bacterium]|nr:choice-of-anchor B family protein [Candidatus Eisenbacteria bacterium]
MTPRVTVIALCACLASTAISAAASAATGVVAFSGAVDAAETVASFEAAAADRGAWNVTTVSHVFREDDLAYSDVWGYDAPDGTSLAFVGYLGGTWILDVTDPATPREVADIPGNRSIWRDFKTAGEHLFIVMDRFSETAGLQVVDLTTPLEPRLVLETSEFFGRSHNIAIDGERLYCVGTYRQAGEPEEVVILDVSEPAAPAEVGRYSLDRFHDIYVRDGIAYGADFLDGELVILDVHDPSAFEVLSRTPDPGQDTHNTWLSDDGRTCFVTSEEEGGYVDVFDVTDLRAPVWITDWKLNEYLAAGVHNVQVQGDLAYCSWYTAGLQVLDVRNPAYPRRVAFVDTHPNDRTFSFDGDWGVFPHTRSGLVYVSDINTGFYVFRVEPQSAEVLVTVVDEQTMSPIADASVEADAPAPAPGDALDASTGADGTVRLVFPVEVEEIRANRFGYLDASAELQLVADMSQGVTLALRRMEVGVVSGRVHVEGETTPVAGADIAVLGAPVAAITESDGSFEVEALPTGAWTVRADHFGFRPLEVEIDLDVTGLDLDLALLPSLYADDFEEDRGWTVGAVGDDATSGVWERVDPIGTGGGQTQPEDDASRDGTFAFVTENGEPGGDGSDSDVDGGVTTLLSPVYDLTDLVAPMLEFRRWFTTSEDADHSDYFEVSVSEDGGVTWASLLRIDANEPSWVIETVELWSRLAGRGQVQFRFVVGDAGVPTIVEGGLDDLQIYEREGGTPLGGSSLALASWPNPFQSSARLQMRIPTEGTVRLGVFDAAGRRVRSLIDGPMAPGFHAMDWDGMGDSGRRVANGVYYLRLETAGGTTTHPVISLR